jgi:predicted amino acid dehydrogenase
MTPYVGPTALDQWQHDRRAAGQPTRVDVVLMTHPRDESDVPRLFPWTDAVADEDRRALVSRVRPTVGEVIAMEDLVAALLFMPFFASELMHPRRRAACRRVVEDEGVRAAAATGASVLCLGGLTGALTAYGRRLVEPAAALGLRVTTGHATTATSVAGTLERACRETGREVSGARLVVVGVGGIGAAVAAMLGADHRPALLTLVDRPEAAERLERLARSLRAEHGLAVAVELTTTDGALAAESAAYDCDLLVSAVSTPQVVDVRRVAPGTILVDDSQPWCWSREDAWRRWVDEGDILPCEAGLVDCTAIGYRSHFPFDFADEGPEGSRVSWSCLAEGMLLARGPDLDATVGEPDVATVSRFRDAFVAQGLEHAALQCGAHLLDPDRFRRVTTRREAVAR